MVAELGRTTKATVDPVAASLDAYEREGPMGPLGDFYDGLHEVSCQHRDATHTEAKFPFCVSCRGNSQHSFMCRR